MATGATRTHSSGHAKRLVRIIFTLLRFVARAHNVVMGNSVHNITLVFSAIQLEHLRIIYNDRSEVDM